MLNRILKGVARSSGILLVEHRVENIVADSVSLYVVELVRFRRIVHFQIDRELDPQGVEVFPDLVIDLFGVSTLLDVENTKFVHGLRGCGGADHPFRNALVDHVGLGKFQGYVICVRCGKAALRGNSTENRGGEIVYGNVVAGAGAGIEERAKAEGRGASFQMVVDDVYASGTGRLVGRPKY